MSLACRVVNGAWRLAGRREQTRFERALAEPEATQREVLMRILRRNAGSEWGRTHGFAAMDSPAAFAQGHPLTDWEDYEPFVERLRRGEQGLLTTEPVRLLEPSSGSTRAAKLVPYTGELAREFRRALYPWVGELFRRDPSLAGGPAYWSVSPAMQIQGGEDEALPLGFADDSEYLGGLLGRLVSGTLAVPSALRHLADLKRFRYASALHLLRCRDLRLISVWHPSFLALLLDEICHQWDRLLRDLRQGRPDLADLRPAPRRSRELSHRSPARPEELWPRLGLISCWADGPAASAAAALARRFPRVRLQPKGLLATEGVVTLPYGEARPLALRSHYFEFQGEDGEVLPAQSLREGGIYQPLLTTGGGLYRYRLQDRVQVTEFLWRTPCLRFLGKADGHVDLVGEKLAEGFVADVLAEHFAGTAPALALLAPDERRDPPGYTLFVTEMPQLPEEFAADLDRDLGANPHYAYARRLGQLAPARIFHVKGDGFAAYSSRLVALGQRLGNIKARALDARSDWVAHLPGTYRDSAAARAGREEAPSCT